MHSISSENLIQIVPTAIRRNQPKQYLILTSENLVQTDCND